MHRACTTHDIMHLPRAPVLGMEPSLQVSPLSLVLLDEVEAETLELLPGLDRELFDLVIHPRRKWEATLP